VQACVCLQVCETMNFNFNNRRLNNLCNHFAPFSTSNVTPNATEKTKPQSSSPTSLPEPDQVWDDLKLVKMARYGRVGILTLNRPQALNALCDPLMSDIGTALNRFHELEDIGAVILTGAGKAFAAGADIKEMVDKNYHQMAFKDKFEAWEVIAKSKLPLIAAVNGVALGGGCEIALMCDIVIASNTAKFGQPEIKIGVFPGAGATQRLVRAIGKSKAMEMMLTGRQMDAQEAERSGLVSHVVPPEELLAFSLKMATEIASYSKPVVILTKEAVNAAFETPLQQGLRFERRVFQGLFALKDKTEGMKAFIEKRKPNWEHS